MKAKKVKETMGLTGVWKFTLTDTITGAVRVFVHKNLIPTVGKAVVASWLTEASPAPASSPRINYTALGSGIVAPALTDTTLGTETYRKLVASNAASSNIGYITAYYTETEVTGTFKEAGLFIAGSSVANSGTLFSRVAINITKSSSETLTIDYTITIS